MNLYEALKKSRAKAVEEAESDGEEYRAVFVVTAQGRMKGICEVKLERNKRETTNWRSKKRIPNPSPYRRSIDVEVGELLSESNCKRRGKDPAATGEIARTGISRAPFWKEVKNVTPQRSAFEK